MTLSDNVSLFLLIIIFMLEELYRSFYVRTLQNNVNVKRKIQMISILGFVLTEMCYLLYQSLRSKFCYL